MLLPRPSRTPNTRPIPSYLRSDRALEMTALLDRQDRTRACCRRRAPIHHNKQIFRTTSKAACLSQTRDSHLRIHISSPMALRTRLRLLSWQTRCAQAVFPSAYQPHRPTRSLQLPSNSLRHKHRRYLRTMAARHSRIPTCNKEISSKAIIRTLRQAPRRHDHLRIPMRWLDR